MIETDRLIIRPWRDADRAPFAAMGQDPDVMRHLGPLMNRAESDAVVDRLIAIQAVLGHTFWALQRRDGGEFTGFCGLKMMPMGIAGLSGTPEIGWRLPRAAWGQGFASEAARACLAWGWRQGMTRIAAMTTADNSRSQAVMRRIGMIGRPDLAFDHPALAADDPLRPHVAFEITS